MYAQYLAVHSAEIRARVMEIRKKLERTQSERGSERFWFAIMASLIVGAETAGKLGLVDIDLKTLTGFLVRNLHRLRGRSIESMKSSDPHEILATYLQMHQDRCLTVDVFPGKGKPKEYLPQILIAPRSERLICHISREEQLARFSKTDFVQWLNTRKMNPFATLRRLSKELGAVEKKVRLGVGTKYEIPTRQIVLQVPVSWDGSAEGVLDE